MTDTGFTPGPWEYREIAPYDDGLGYISADGHDIIHAGVSDLPANVNRANAQLIAAAPALYAALKIATDIAESWIHDQLEGTSSLESELAKLEPCHAALNSVEQSK